MDYYAKLALLILSAPFTLALCAIGQKKRIEAWLTRDFMVEDYYNIWDKFHEENLPNEENRPNDCKHERLEKGFFETFVIPSMKPNNFKYKRLEKSIFQKFFMSYTKIMTCICDHLQMDSTKTEDKKFLYETIRFALAIKYHYVFLRDYENGFQLSVEDDIALLLNKMKDIRRDAAIARPALLFLMIENNNKHFIERNLKSRIEHVKFDKAAYKANPKAFYRNRSEKILTMK